MILDRLNTPPRPWTERELRDLVAFLERTVAAARRFNPRAHTDLLREGVRARHAMFDNLWRT